MNQDTYFAALLDIDECAVLVSPCVNADCINFQGSFRCECTAPGMTLDSTRLVCVGKLFEEEPLSTQYSAGIVLFYRYFKGHFEPITTKNPFQSQLNYPFFKFDFVKLIFYPGL